MISPALTAIPIVISCPHRDAKHQQEPETMKKVKGNPQLLLRVPPELQKPLADESAKTGETRQGVLWRIATKYFRGRKA
jgi:hypothetical protein